MDDWFRNGNKIGRATYYFDFVAEEKKILKGWACEYMGSAKDQPLRFTPIGDGVHSGCVTMTVYGERFRSEVYNFNLHKKPGVNLDAALGYEINKAVKEITDKADRMFGPIWRREIGKNYAYPTTPLSHRLLPRTGDAVAGYVYMVVRGRRFERFISCRCGALSERDLYSYQVKKAAEEICREADAAFGRTWVFEVGLGFMDDRSCVNYAT